MKESAMYTISEEPPLSGRRADHTEIREIDRTIALARAHRAEFLGNMVSAGLRRLHIFAMTWKRRFTVGARRIRDSLSHV